MKRIAYLCVLAVMLCSCGSRLGIVNMTVEMQDGSRPLGTAQPRFGWNYEATVDNVVQVDYRIIVASSKENAKKGIGDLWDSKTVETSRMLYIRELWNGDTGDPAMNSGNHVMLLGDLVIWYYEFLGGICALEPGYSLIQLKPYPIEGLDHVDCAYNSVSGRIESNWRRKGNRFEWDFLIPPNTTAEVYLPTHDGYARKRVLGSGRHHLTSTLK